MTLNLLAALLVLVLAVLVGAAATASGTRSRERLMFASFVTAILAAGAEVAAHLTRLP